MFYEIYINILYCKFVCIGKWYNFILVNKFIKMKLVIDFIKCVIFGISIGGNIIECIIL